MVKPDSPETPTVPEMLTVAEAARILNIGRTTAYEGTTLWLKSGGKEGIPAKRVGRLIRIPTAELEEHFGIRLSDHAAKIVRLNRTRARSDSSTKTARPPESRRRSVPSRSATQHALPFKQVGPTDVHTAGPRPRKKASSA